MRQTISGLTVLMAVMFAGAAPASAWCGGEFAPCANTYTQAYAGCGCGAAYERLPDPQAQYHRLVAQPQYYYVDQGPTYSGPGYFAPRRVYREEGLSDWRAYHHRLHHFGHYHAYGHYPWHHHHWHQYGYHYRPHVLHSYY